MLGSLSTHRSILLASLALLMVVVALSLSTSAWTTKDVDFTDGDYTSGRVYDLGPVCTKEPMANTSSWTRMQILNTYRGYLSAPLEGIDDGAYIHSVYVSILATCYPPGEVQLKLMTLDPRYADADTIWDQMGNAYSLSLLRVDSNTTDFYRVDLTGRALDILRDQVASGGRYLTMGFMYFDSSPFIYQRSEGLYSFVRLQIDALPPAVPNLDPVPPFSAGNALSLSWSAVSDLPAGGSVGGVEYQVGLFLNASSPGEPWHLTAWLPGTSWDLNHPEDGREYIVRVRARDGSGFTSEWSSPVSTTVDNSPPSVPVLIPEPEYTDGLGNTVSWWPSTDEGVGTVRYELNYSIDADFSEGTTVFTEELGVELFFLKARTYFYRVRAIDALGHVSPWSLVESSTQDQSAPFPPVIHRMPEYTPYKFSEFSWSPSHDEGVGVWDYYWEVSTSVHFRQGDVVYSMYTPACSARTGELEPDRTYWYRVRARDLFGHWSYWSSNVSSYQDYSAPSRPAVHAIPELMPVGPLTLSWDPAHDDGVGVASY